MVHLKFIYVASEVGILYEWVICSMLSLYVTASHPCMGTKNTNRIMNGKAIGFALFTYLSVFPRLDRAKNEMWQEGFV